MTDKEQIEALYRKMYKAMVEKDTATLNRVHADSFVLTHMTGMHQSKQEYIRAIAGGTLNYYSAEHEQMDIEVNGDRATLTGRAGSMPLSLAEAVIRGACSYISTLSKRRTNGCLWPHVHQHIEKAIRKLADLQIFSISTSFLLIEKRL